MAIPASASTLELASIRLLFEWWNNFAEGESRATRVTGCSVRVKAPKIRPGWMPDENRQRRVWRQPERATGYVHLPMIDGENGAFVVVDRASVLANVAGVVNPTRKLAKFAAFDRFQRAYTDFGRFGDLLKRNAPIAADRGEPEDARFRLSSVP